jgi:hypothetical protein
VTDEPQPLPQLIDSKGIQEEMGVGRTIAEAIMEKIPKVQIDGRRRVYVKRADVLRYIEERSVL